MANAYCSITQFGWFFDVRQAGMLANDTASAIPDNATLQAMLDSGASELDSHLAGRVALPITSPPLILARLTAAMTVQALYLRRTDVPKGAKALIDWMTDWIKLFDSGKVSIPANPRMTPSPKSLCSDRAIDSARHNLTETL